MTQYHLFARRPEGQSRKISKKPGTLEEHKATIDQMEKSNKWPEGHDAVAEHVDGSHSYFYSDKWEKLHGHDSSQHSEESMQYSEINPGPNVQVAGLVPVGPPISLRPGVAEQFAEGNYISAHDSHEPQEGHRVRINYGEHRGKTGTVTHLAPSGKFVGVAKGNKHLGYFHTSDLHYHKEDLDADNHRGAISKQPSEIPS